MMPRTELTTQPTVTVTLSPLLKRKLLLKMRTYEQLVAEMNVRDAACDKILAEVEELFAKAGQQQALADGARVDGFSVKKVEGETSTFDQLGFMVATNTTLADFAKHTTKKPKKAFVKITCPKAKKEGA
jgi:phage FluMu protein Com